MKNDDNYYDILGVSKSATLDEIKQSYKKLAKEFHPDKNRSKSIDTTEKFQQIQTAYETLSDPEKKNQYDNPCFNFGGGGISSSDIFSNIFRGFSVKSDIKKSHVTHNCKITLDEVFTGITKKFNIKRDLKCNICKITCSICNGQGMVTQHIQMGPFTQIINKPCHSCKSSGNVRKFGICSICNSTGFITEIKQIQIVIPMGTENNKTYTFSDWGNQPTKPGEIPGDLIVIVLIEDHPYFKRHKLDLIYETEINLRESITGKNIIIPHFIGGIEINTISMFGVINPNKQYIIKNKGLIGDNKFGDLYIKFKITYPENKKFSDIEIKLLKETFDTVIF